MQKLLTRMNEASAKSAGNLANNGVSSTGEKVVFGNVVGVDGSQLKPTHLRVEGPIGNCHRERRYNLNVTLVKTCKSKEPVLQDDEYYARMTYDPAKSTVVNMDGETGLDALKPSGRIVVSKQFSAVNLPLPNMRTFLVRVENPDLCFVMK